jgi:FtsP/CotA-like multicopper oxidase with cupredoxin domain
MKRVPRIWLVALAPVLVAAVMRAAEPHARPADPDPPRIAVNDNRSPAGDLSDGVLRVSLVADVGLWYPELEHGPGLVIQAFGEEGKPLQVPGPLIRVPAGTEVRLRLRNALAVPLLVRGLQDRPADSLAGIDLAPGETREIAFHASTPGTYYYWGRTRDDREGIGVYEDGQLLGALVVDPPGTTAADRVMIIGLWGEVLPPDAPESPEPRHTFVVNGLAWPYTERLGSTVGDTLRWRVINGNVAGHPMHLHGFYYHVDSHGTAERDTTYDAVQRRLVVTEFLRGGSTMSMTWVPKKPGNWLFHCHLVAHIAPALRLGTLPPEWAGDEHHPANHAFAAMAGLVMGIDVRPQEGTPTLSQVEARRRLRLYVNHRPNHFGEHAGYGYILQEGDEPPAADSIRIPGSVVALRRDEPVEVTILNRSPEPVTVHWHGIELESYYDGVGDWSGWTGHTAPPVMPGDSFVVRMTPDRAGTFIYHTHMEEGSQLSAGLYGPLIVLGPGEELDLERDVVLLIGRGGVGADAPALLSGASDPAPLEWTPGTTYRLRLINITPSNGEMVRLLADTTLQTWRAFAKDGAELPGHQATERPAAQFLGPGETYDFEFTPAEPGELVLVAEVRRRGLDPLFVRQTIHVGSPGGAR